LTLLDKIVGIHESHEQAFGEKNADSAFTRAGHSYENNVVQAAPLCERPFDMLRVTSSSCHGEPVEPFPYFQATLRHAQGDIIKLSR
jgi:hypothetical protein